jgi:hypothetical protein
VIYLSITKLSACSDSEGPEKALCRVRLDLRNKMGFGTSNTVGSDSRENRSRVGRKAAKSGVKRHQSGRDSAFFHVILRSQAECVYLPFHIRIWDMPIQGPPEHLAIDLPNHNCAHRNGPDQLVWRGVAGRKLAL